MLSQFKVIGEDGGQKLATLSAAAAAQARAQLPATVPSALPSQALLGGLEEPLIAYKLEDYTKKLSQHAAEGEVKRTNISIEGLLQTPAANLGKTPFGLATSLGHPSLMQLSRHMPSVSLSSSSPIHQLLSGISRPTGTGITPVTASTLPPSPTFSTFLTGIKTVSGQSGGITQSPELTMSTSSAQSGTLSQTSVSQVSQSGSPLQNSVPTLMSSLTKGSGYSVGNVIKIITSTSSPAEHGTDPSPEEKKRAVQSLNFSDCTTSSVSIQVTQDQVTDSSAPAGVQIKEIAPVHDDIPVTVKVNLNPSSSLCQIMSASPIVSSVLQPVTSVPRIHTGSSTASLQAAATSFQETAADMETLGKVSSLLESSPVTERHCLVTSGIASPGPSLARPQQIGAVSVTVVTASQKVSTSKVASSMSTTYTATPKPSLSTLATTRTRRIRTPKQYDL